MSRIVKLSLALFAFSLWAASAQAITSLTLDNCDGGCKGADLTLAVEQQGTDWIVTYTFDTTGYNNTKLGLNQVGFKVITGWTDADLLSAPNGVGNWSEPLEGPVNSDGSPCTGKNDDSTDKVCIFAKNEIFDARVDGSYEFKFKLTGGSMMDPSEWHFGGQWANAFTDRGNIISDGAPAVPEPSAALLFALGAVTVRRSLRRR